jgi:HD-GYP domain-containing protein (c-di-GMP phosphodiesterase class II)
VAEAFDALTSERAHRSSRTIDEALGVIESESGRHFDPQFTALLLRIVREQRHDWQAHVERARAELQRCESGQTQTS